MKWHPKKESSIFWNVFWTHNHRGIVIIFKKIQVYTICRSKIVVQTDQPLDWSMRNHIGRRTAKGLRSVSGNFPSYLRNTNSLNRWPNNSRVRFERRNLKPNTSLNHEKKGKERRDGFALIARIITIASIRPEETVFRKKRKKNVTRRVTHQI